MSTAYAFVRGEISEYQSDRDAGNDETAWFDDEVSHEDPLFDDLGEKPGMRWHHWNEDESSTKPHPTESGMSMPRGFVFGAKPIATRDMEITRKFEILSTQLKGKSMTMSLTRDMEALPEYIELISLGRSILPLIIDDLQQTPWHWYPILKELTNCDPVLPEHRGRSRKMRADWLAWAEKAGYGVY